ARFLRNVLVAAGNSGDAGLVPAAEALLGHDSPLVRGMAVWALRCLLDENGFLMLRASHVPHEVDATVLVEWG
ncbi:MAG: tRNA epoxyqueuosine(34) reductase QueG, partial [Candidatus Puniceispirillaceae bacterium]